MSCRPMRSVPRDPLALARFALVGTPSVHHTARRFTTDAARALLAGTAAHSMEPLTAPLTSAFGLLLTALGHGVGWPVVAGGSAAITQGLANELRRLGGEVHTDRHVASLAELPPARAVLLDTSPRAFVALAGTQLVAPGRPALGAVQARSPGPAKSTGRSTARCPGGPRPAVAPSPCTSGGRSTRWHGRRRPCTPAGMPSSPSSWWPNPAWSTRRGRRRGSSTLWAYCHVPNGSSVDMTERIEAQIERFAPGFRDLVLARSVRTRRRGGGPQPQPVGWRRQRRSGHAASDGLPAGGAVESLSDARRGRLPLLGLDAPGGRRARDVRRGRGRGGVAGALRLATSP